MMATCVRWIGAAAAIFLRKPKVARSGRLAARSKISSALTARFDLWDEGHYSALLDTWRRDTERARARQPSEGLSLRLKVIRLIHGGNITKAVRMAASLGLGDTTKPEIRDQANAKHPARKEPVFATADEYLSAYGDGNDEVPRLAIDIISTLEKLERLVAAGCNGWRNEHLSALVPPLPFEDRDAMAATQHIAAFADRWVNGALPESISYRSVPRLHQSTAKP